ncbi:hypothetical protein PENSPDRAFT_17771 [Peniophora sp. CONT]|nr:hypothetical protein PENSPDRAFT_17771 [Peniophora sp. CONT]
MSIFLHHRHILIFLARKRKNPPPFPFLALVCRVLLPAPDLRGVAFTLGDMLFTLQLKAKCSRASRLDARASGGQNLPGRAAALRSSRTAFACCRANFDLRSCSAHAR